MIRDPQCDNDNCEQDGGRWVHAAECPAAADAQGTEDMALATANEDGLTSMYIPRRPDWKRAAA